MRVDASTSFDYRANQAIQDNQSFITVFHAVPWHDEYRGGKSLHLDLPLPAKAAYFTIAAPGVDREECAITTSGEYFGDWLSSSWLSLARVGASGKSGAVHAGPAIMRAIVDRVHLLIINRFGRAESLGRGLRACFEAAIAADVPVLTAVRPPYDQAWQNFHGGFGLSLPCDEDQVAGWVTGVAASKPTSDCPLNVSA